MITRLYSKEVESCSACHLQSIGAELLLFDQAQVALCGSCLKELRRIIHAEDPPLLAGRGAGAGHAREREALVQIPGVSAIAEEWCGAFKSRGQSLDLLRAAARAMRAGFNVDEVRGAIRAVARCLDHPEEFPERSLVSWACANSKRDAAYLLRPMTLSKLLVEASDWQHAYRRGREGA